MEAIILAGGLGTRLRSAVSDRPKCLAPIGEGCKKERRENLQKACPPPDTGRGRGPLDTSYREAMAQETVGGAERAKRESPFGGFSAAACGTRPFLYYLLEDLGRQGVSRVILSVGYKHEAVMEWMASQEWPFEVSYAVEESPLGTGGAIRLALSMAREERVLVLNGDTFFQLPSLKALLEVEAPMALALKPMRDFDRYGEVSVDRPSRPDRESVIPSGKISPRASLGRDDKSVLVTAFHEKRPCAEGLINGGVYALDRGLFDGLGDLPEKFSFEKEALEPMAAKGKVRGLVSDGYFIDIGVPEDYARAQQELPELQRVLRAYTAALKMDAETLFLDRDGVINRHLPGDYVKRWEAFVFLPGVLQMLARCAAHFRHIFVVTNQRGVGRGRMSRETLDAIHARMASEIERSGGRIDAIYVSTAIPDDDPTRKPQPGMFLAACRDFPDISPGRSLMMGDSDSDEAFAAACGMEFIMV